MVKKHARLVREFYLFEQRWARMQDFLIPNLQLMRNLYSGSDREGVDLRRILIKKLISYIFFLHFFSPPSHPTAIQKFIFILFYILIFFFGYFFRVQVFHSMIEIRVMGLKTLRLSIYFIVETLWFCFSLFILIFTRLFWNLYWEACSSTHVNDNDNLYLKFAAYFESAEIFSITVWLLHYVQMFFFSYGLKVVQK